VYEKVRATGAEVLQEPIDQPYGVRDCGFRDPAGGSPAPGRLTEGRQADDGAGPGPGRMGP